MSQHHFTAKQQQKQFGPLAQQLADLAAGMDVAPRVGNFIMATAYSQLKANLMALVDQVDHLENCTLNQVMPNMPEQPQNLMHRAIVETGHVQ